MPTRDPSGRDRILASALELFADRGAAAVSVRDIAAAAHVSPANVLHHFGSKQGLREAVDAHVAGAFERALASVPDARQALAGQGEDPGGSLGEAFAAVIASNPFLGRYLVRLILEQDPRATHLIRTWVDQTAAVLAEAEAQGLVRTTDDPSLRAAFLTVNDLAVLLMREQLGAHLGWDPLSPEGMQRWGRAAMTLYTHGLYVAETNASQEEP